MTTATLKEHISDNWPKGTKVFLNNKHFCTINGSCLEADLIYGNDKWEITEGPTVSDDTSGTR